MDWWSGSLTLVSTTTLQKFRMELASGFTWPATVALTVSQRHLFGSWKGASYAWVCQWLIGKHHIFWKTDICKNFWKYHILTNRLYLMLGPKLQVEPSLSWCFSFMKLHWVPASWPWLSLHAGVTFFGHSSPDCLLSSNDDFFKPLWEPQDD